MHIASTGGVWSSLVSGFAGLRDQGAVPYFDPRLPAEWDGLSFHLKIQGRLLQLELAQGAISLTVREGAPLEVDVRGELLTVDGDTVRVPLAPVAAPEPTIFPSGLPTASIPIVRAAV